MRELEGLPTGLKLRGLSVFVGLVRETKLSVPRLRAEIPRGCEWTAAYVKVKGFVRVARELGMSAKAHMLR